ncbi:MAG TPA: hypothetical protein PLE30_04860 [Candidatus Kapabacteria bacterium]|nr:hypothetical protein [Candidatus Kapabacteria bacterium]
MIELLIFYLHIAGALFAFTMNWQSRGIKEALLAIGIIGLFFTIGWALTGTIANLIYPDSWNTIYFSQDTLSLVILLVPEILFYYFYFLKDKPTDDSPLTI